MVTNEEKIVVMSDRHPMARTIKDMQPKFYYPSALYLHCDAERVWGYDIAFITNWRNLDCFKDQICSYSHCWGEEAKSDTKNVNPRPFINGVYNVQVIGDPIPCVGFFWTTEHRKFPVIYEDTVEKEVVEDWRQIALICHVDDVDAIADARDKYNRRTSCV